MAYTIIKVLLTALIVVAISEIGKRSTLFASLVASLPLTSILAILWLYIDTGSTEKVMNLSLGIFWIVIPSIVFFLALYALLKNGLGFPQAMLASIAIMNVSYTAYIYALKKLGINI